MGIVNKRNAVLGWLTWNVGKRVARRKAKRAVPHVPGSPRKKGAIAAGVAAVGGVLLFWRKKAKRGGGTGGDAAA